MGMFSAEKRPTRDLLFLAIIFAICSIALARSMAPMSNSAPLRWLFGAALIGVWHLNFVRQHLSQNCADADAAPYPTLGIANIMSTTRGLLNAWLAGFILAPVPSALIWLPAILWTTSALLDIFDGVAARATRRQSLLGEALDMEFDAVAILIICTYTVVHQIMPVWYIALGLARYLFVAGLSWRTNRGLPTADLTDSEQRRVEAGMQMAFMTVVLWPIVGKPLTMVAAYSFGVPFGLLFLRDWLVVSTWLDPTNPSYLKLRRAVHALIYSVLPLCLRIFLAFLLITGRLPLRGNGVLVAITVVASFMLLLGVISRFGAIFLLIPLVFGGIVLPWNAILLVLVSAVIKFGGGPFCLWLPEERIFRKRLGG